MAEVTNRPEFFAGQSHGPSKSGRPISYPSLGPASDHFFLPTGGLNVEELSD